MFITEGILAGSLMLGAIFYGVHIAIFLTINYLAHGSKKHTTVIPVWVCASTWVLMILGTTHVAGSLLFLFKSWRNGHNISGGPAEWMIDNYTDWSNVLARASISPAYLIQDLILLHRMYTIYTMCRFRAVAIAVFLLIIVGSSVINVFQFLDSVWPAGMHWLHNIGPYRIAHCSFAAALTVGTTIAIIIRMLCLRRRVAKYLGPEHTKIYNSAAAMFVESNALFSIIATICAVPNSHVLGEKYYSIANYSTVHAAGISTGPSAVRVAFGRAWSEGTLSRAYEPIQFPSESTACASQSRV